MKKIIHLSDTHVGYKVCGHMLDRIVADIIHDKEPARDYVVVATGDLVDDATCEGNYAEAKGYFDCLTSAGFDVLVVPGNHDYGTGALASRQYVKKFKKAFYGKASVTYPKLDIIDGVAFIGLDSMAEEVNWYDRLFAEGELGKAQLTRLKNMLKRTKVKACDKRVVYLHHHPFDAHPFHQLKDSVQLRQTLKGTKVDALLYGHNHAAKTRNGKWDISRCYDGGTATHKNGDAGCHRVIDLSKDPRWDYDGAFG
jgi:3',5'-cyclic AMP phosphodiesterase CpdA